MTRKEAIGNLNMIRVAFIDTVTVEQGRLIDDTFIMAIKALKQEPCEDAISRQEALGCCRNEWEEEVEMRLKSLPPVNPQPKTGHWINVNEGKWNTIPAYKCSACGANADLRDWSGESPFCPWCGAKMIEPQETETWNGIHAQLTAPKGTFERIFNEADDDNDI